MSFILVSQSYFKNKVIMNYSMRMLFFFNRMGFRQSFLLKETNDYLDAKIHNLHCTNDRESSQKSHGSSYCREHVHKLGCSIFGDSIKLGGFEIYFHISHLWSYINIYSQIDSKLLNEQIMTWYLPLSSDGSLIAPLY